jgi:hypothetical protein
MTIEVHTENGIEGIADGRRESSWKLYALWLAMISLLVAVVLLIGWIGSVNASAAGGCGGG